MERLRPLWERLCRHSPAATLFQSFELNLLAAKMLNSERPFIVAAETESGAAIIPAAISGDCATLLGDCLFDYRDILGDGDPEALGMAWQAIADLNLPMRFCGLREDAVSEMWQLADRSRWSAAPFVPRSTSSAEQFSAAHTRLGSRLRKLERAGAELKRYTGSDSRLVRWIYEQKARQLATRSDGVAPNVFADRQRVDFMVAWCAAAGAQCEIFCLEAGNGIVSALVTFRDTTSRAEARRFYTVYFDPRWEKFSPGTVLVYEVARQTLAENLDADFMTGEQPHKLRLATASMPLYRIELQPASLHELASELEERARVAA